MAEETDECLKVRDGTMGGIQRGKRATSHLLARC
jgi:hypothetical protein